MLLVIWVVLTLQRVTNSTSGLPTGAMEWFLMVTCPQVALLSNLYRTYKSRGPLGEKTRKMGLVDQLMNVPLMSRFSVYEATYVSGFSAYGKGSLFEYDEIMDDGLKARLQKDKEALVVTSVLIALAGFALFMVVFMSQLAMGMTVLLFLFYVAASQERNPTGWVINPLDQVKVKKQEGLYRIYKVCFGFERFMGVGTLQDGVFQTRLHVLEGEPRSLKVGDDIYSPYGYNVGLDVISWGGAAVYRTPEDGQEVKVEILPVCSDSTVTYVTKAHMLEDGDVVFSGLKTIGGVSGSPYFLKTIKTDPMTGVEYTDWVFSGNIGMNFSNDYRTGEQAETQIEILRKGEDQAPGRVTEVKRGGMYQNFSHPGSGKTRKEVPALISQGLTFCHNVVVAGPTRVVAREIYEGLRSAPGDVSLLVKGQMLSKRSARVIITTHATLLRMLMDKDTRLKKSTGFIVDEAHFDQSTTKQLLAYLRDQFGSREATGFYVEMTATGKDLKTDEFVSCDDSNYEIDSIPYDDFLTTVKEVVATNPGKRILIFCSQVHGGSMSVQRVKEEIYKLKTDHKVIPMYRMVYESASRQIAERNPQGVVIIATSIAECGANYDVDIVVDCCTMMAYVESSPEVYTVIQRPIDYQSMVQRRGRTGRKRKGEYYYYSRAIFDPPEPNDAEEDDVRQFGGHLGLLTVQGRPYEGTIPMSAGQFGSWIRQGQEAVSNARTAKLLYQTNGARNSNEMIMMNIRNQLLGGDNAIRLGGKTIYVKWWDDRDRVFLMKMLTRMQILDRVDHQNEERPGIVRYAVKRMMYRRRPENTWNDSGVIYVGGVPYERDPLLE